ncbi:MAG: hypothetical protein PUA83_05345 [Clostridiales bacterium]|nr:hypothetical protein [Clostridiales bacterium]
MKKMFVKRICVYFTVTILFATLLNFSAFATDTNKLAKESTSSNEYQLLLTEFKHQKLNGEIAADYPDYYAGAYINNDGELVILVTDSSDSITSKVSELTRNTEINIEYAPVSYNTLEAQKNLIFNTALSIRTAALSAETSTRENEVVNVANSVVGVGLNEKENKIVVCISDTSKANISAFRKYISDYENISFELSGTIDEQATAIKAGDAAYNTAGNICSIGYRAKYTTSGGTTYYGFVTAGHAVAGGQYAIYHNSTGVYCGSVYTYQHQSNLADAAFITLSSNVTMGTSTKKGVSITGSSSIPSVATNQTVYLEAKSTSSTSALTGTVKGTSYSWVSSSGITISDAIRIDYGEATYAGDSGGIVYAYSGGYYKAIGIHTGYNSLLGNGIATKASNIKNEMGVIPY